MKLTKAVKYTSFIPLLSLESGIIVNKFQTLLLSIRNSGVIRFDVMSHREKEWTEDYKTKQWKSRRYRRCIERRSLFAISISNLYTKRLSQNSYQESVRYASVALCAVSTSVTLHYLRPLRDSVCPLYKPFNLSSIFRKSLLLPCYHVLNTLLPCLLLPLYLVLNILLLCLLLPCTMSYITLLPCLTLPCLIKECKTTKKS